MDVFPGDGFSVAVVDEENFRSLGVAVVAADAGTVPFAVFAEFGGQDVAGSWGVAG